MQSIVIVIALCGTGLLHGACGEIIGHGELISSCKPSGAEAIVWMAYRSLMTNAIRFSV
jgi:hypothetical protein